MPLQVHWNGLTEEGHASPSLAAGSKSSQPSGALFCPDLQVQALESLGCSGGASLQTSYPLVVCCICQEDPEKQNQGDLLPRNDL